MAFSDQIASDMAVFYNTDEFAVSGTYKGVTIDMQIVYGDADREDEPRKDFRADKAELTVKYTDVAAPAYRDVVVINSVKWYVQRIIEGDGYDWTLGIETDERPKLNV